jgi:hypothetical protein
MRVTRCKSAPNLYGETGSFVTIVTCNGGYIITWKIKLTRGEKSGIEPPKVRGDLVKVVQSIIEPPRTPKN